MDETNEGMIGMPGRPDDDAETTGDDRDRVENLAQTVARNVELTTALGARIEQMAADVGYLATQLLATSSAPPVLPPDLATLPGRLDELSVTLRDVRSRLSSLDGVTEQAARVVGQLATLGERLGSASAGGSAATGADDLREEVGAIRRQLEELAARPAPTADGGAELAARLDAAVSALSSDRLVQAAEGLNEGLGRSDDAVATLRTLASQAVEAATSGSERTAAAAERMATDSSQTLAEVSASVSHAVSSMAGAQQAADLAAQSAQQTVGTMQEAIAALLTTQLSEYDQRQSSIEEGLRALWGRLDQVDVALQDLGAGGGQATATELQEVLSSTLLGFSDHMTDRTAAVTSAAVGELVAGVPGEVTEAVTALTDLVTVVGEAVAGLPERIASLVSDRFADQMSVALRALPDELHDAVADLPAAVSARVEDSVGGLPDTIGDLLAQVSIQLTRKISDDLERLPEQVGARIAEELDHLPAAIAEHTAGRLAGAGGASQVDPEALEDMVHVAAERVGDTIAARLEATIAQVSGFVPDAVEQAARSIESSVRSGVAQSVATTLGQALDSLLGPSVEEAVEAALGARPASSGEVTTEMVLAAADAAASAAATAAASAASGAAATAAAHAAADAVSEAMTTLPAVSRAGTESPELTSGLISAVAGTIDDFGTQVDGALDEMASRIDSLSDGMQRLAAVLEDMLSRRRGPSTEAVTLLRQVAAEGAEAPMPPPRPPAAEPAPESAPSGGTPRRAPDDSPGPRPPAKAARPKATSGRAPAATKGGSAAPGRGDPRSAGTERWRQRNG